MEITLKVLFPRQIFDLATNFQRKFDNDHCNDVEKQSNFKKFDCLKADLSAFVETLSVSTFYNHYNDIREICGLSAPVRLVITLGYADQKDTLRVKKRKKTDELVTYIKGD